MAVSEELQPVTLDVEALKFIIRAVRDLSVTHGARDRQLLADRILSELQPLREA